MATKNKKIVKTVKNSPKAKAKVKALPKAKAKAKAKPKAKAKTKRAEPIGLVIDYKETLNELKRSQIHTFYKAHYTPLKQLIILHNHVLHHPQQAAYLETIVDEKIKEMNKFAHSNIDAARAAKAKLSRKKNLETSKDFNKSKSLSR